MNYGLLAAFLTTYTTPGFKRSLRFSPYATLIRCGFGPSEATQLALLVNRGIFEPQRFSFAFQSISVENVIGSTSATDDWAAPG
jgi:hypothetical protein